MSGRTTLLAAALGLGVVALVGVQAWQQQELRDRVAELEAAHLEVGEEAARAEARAALLKQEVRSLRDRLRTLEARALFEEDAEVARTSAERQVSTRGKGPSLLIVGAKGPRVERQPAQDQPLDEAVTAALEEARDAQLREQGATYVSEATARLESTVDDLVSAGTIDAGKRQAVVDLMVGEAHEVWELKAEVQRGELGQDEAVAEYEELRLAYTQALEELLGEGEAEAVMATRGQGGR